jgi:class 3 adenylate cyclase
VSVQTVERKLAAIFAADVAGYSRLMARNEVATLVRLKACRAIIDGLIASHRGRIFNVESYRRRAALERRRGPGRPPVQATINANT